ncbi:MAG: hypothetical protein LUF04_07190 [Bacteroides sp.]|nr:hypothetical protein [Bacteroides sp.]
MLSLEFDITIGGYKLTLLDSVVVKRSVESLGDVATITLPGAVYNRALEIESKISVGDPVTIRFGYASSEKQLQEEFSGFVESIATDDGSIRITCEDEIFHFWCELDDKVLPHVSLEELLQHVLREIGGYQLSCDYSFKYDSFAIYQMTAYDVLKKVQEETKANVYLRGKTLHLHPHYARIEKKVIYDFTVNVEKSELIYKDASKRKFLAVLEGIDEKGNKIRVSRGEPGGDVFTMTLPAGVSDRESLERRAEEEVNIKSYTGYEGSLTGWLIPYVEPTFAAEIRDADYEYKNGAYYVLEVETSFSEKGGSRKVTIGKKVEV